MVKKLLPSVKMLLFYNTAVFFTRQAGITDRIVKVKCRASDKRKKLNLCALCASVVKEPFGNLCNLNLAKPHLKY